MEFKGKVLFVDVTKDVSTTDKEFLTRTFGVEAEDEVNGSVYTNQVGFQANGSRCELLDNINIGDTVSVTYSAKGTLKKSDKLDSSEKNPDSKVIFTNLIMSKIEVLEKVGEVKTESGQGEGEGKKKGLPF